jgi:hypothetical protein
MKEIQIAFYTKKRDEYEAAMIDAKAIHNHKLADEMYKLYNEYNELI